MQFRCGTCGTYYLIENAEQISRKQKLRCTGCGNIFVLQKDLTFSSASRDSKLICGRCGSLIDEAQQVCQTCNPAIKSLREEFRIDNKDYEFFVVRNGRLRPRRRRNSGAGKALLLAGAAALAVSAAVWLLLSAERRDALQSMVLKPPGKASKTETLVVIMRSGQTYYADRIERGGGQIEITGKDGLSVTVDEKDVLQTAKAVLED